MLTPSTYRALIITVLLFSILALGLLNIHLQGEEEEQLFSVEYYFEEKEEQEEVIEEEPEQSENLETHKAYNEAKEEILKSEKNLKETQDDFERQMQAMDEALKASNKSPALPELSQKETYAQSNEVIHNENVKRTSSVSYYLENRTAIYLPSPVYTCPKGGTIVVNITVDNLGKVIHTNVDNSKSTTSDRCLNEQALEYAKQAKFDVSESSDANQKGTITYRFIGS